LAAAALCLLAGLPGCTTTSVETHPNAGDVAVVELLSELKGCESLGKVVGNASDLRAEVEPQRSASLQPATVPRPSAAIAFRLDR
jgi:hypothetical protein